MTWKAVYRNDFVDLRDVHAQESPPAVNTRIGPGDADNASLQKPSVPGGVSIVADAAAGDGKALRVDTAVRQYLTAAGPAVGWTNGRLDLQNHDQAPPFRVRARIRFTPSVETKSAVMWWPNAKGWPWEVDWAETFGGRKGDPIADRRRVTFNYHHARTPGRGAKPHRSFEADVDATSYHVYDLYVTPQRMWETLDGKLVGDVGPEWIPSGPGHVAIGKALTGTRAGQHTEDAVFVDWLEIYKPVTG